MDKARIAAHFDRYAPGRDAWQAKNHGYYEAIERLCRARIPEGRRVLELGCGTGDLLASLRPSLGVGVDVSHGMVARARAKHPGLRFVRGDAEAVPLVAAFDHIVMSDVVGHLGDIQGTLLGLRRLTTPETTLVVTYYNFVWQPILNAGERLGLKMPQHQQNWLGMADIRNLLFLCDWEVASEEVALLCPKRIPIVAPLLNAMVRSPLFSWAALVQVFVARPRPAAPVRRDLSVTVVIPTRNERGNVAAAVARTPAMGRHTEILFVDGRSTDGTVEEIERQIARTAGVKDVKLVHQVPPAEQAARPAGAPPDLMLPQGKGDAVRKGFAAATGDVLMILDADLTVPPEDLPRFYDVIAQGKGRFVNGTRLVYPLEDEAMKFVNLLGNKGFSWIFTWLLSQRIKDTLCGTKVLLRTDYEEIARNRAHFGEFDPFGDFDLLFGAARLSLPIVEVPVRYQRRRYGETKVRVLRHGILLARMSLIGLRKLKLARRRSP
ncbi:MAG: glycosyltransferase [Acidobacteriota bacterium]